MTDDLSFVEPRNPSYGLHTDFNFSILNKNLLQEFNQNDSISPLKDEHMPVYLRVRPLIPFESGEKIIICKGKNSVILTLSKNDKLFKNQPCPIGQPSHAFSFSRVFGEETLQLAIFNEIVLSRVDEFLDGVNSLVFAYGTTSSGKTFTLQGNIEHVGIIPRTLDTIFNSVKLASHDNFSPRGYEELTEMTQTEKNQQIQDKKLLLQLSLKIGHTFDENLSQKMNSRSFFKDGVAYNFWISFAEIYNEVAYDLLDPAAASHAIRNGSSFESFNPRFGPNAFHRTPLDMRTDKKGNIFIKGLRWYPITSSEDAYRLLMVGRCCQQVGATRLNKSSSRSHSIFSIKSMRCKLTDKDGAPRFARMSSLNFCDLAGSERCEKAATLHQINRFREANSINTSLLALWKCIDALRYNQRNPNHPRVVPYRESKLTRLFQNFFTGRGKACMIVNVAPCAGLGDETLQALRFSSLASQVMVQSNVVTEMDLGGANTQEKVNAASNNIQRQLREQLTKHGFKPRGTGSFFNKSGKWGDVTLNNSDETTNGSNNESKSKKFMNENEAPGMTVGESMIPEFLNDEMDLASLSKADLIEIINELSRAVAKQPAEIEAATKRIQAEVSETMSEELFRLEDQYEALLLEQEKTLEAEFLKRIPPRKSMAVLSKPLSAVESSFSLDDVIESTQSTLTNICSFKASEYDNDNEEPGTPQPCLSCARYADELKKLQQECEDIKGDLADQQDAISNLTQERDEFQVEVRRLEYLIQMTKVENVGQSSLSSVTNNNHNLDSAGQTKSRAVKMTNFSGKTFFPSLYTTDKKLECERRASFEQDGAANSDSDDQELATVKKMPAPNTFFPDLIVENYKTNYEEDDNVVSQTPSTIIKVKRKENQHTSVTATDTCSYLELRSANQCLLAQLSSLRSQVVRLDHEKTMAELEVSNLLGRSRCGDGSLSYPSSSRQSSHLITSCQIRQTMSIGMQSFLGHEDEIEKAELHGMETNKPVVQILHSLDPTSRQLKLEDQLLDAFKQVSILEKHNKSVVARDLKESGLQKLPKSTAVSPFTSVDRHKTATQKSDVASQTEFKCIPAQAYFSNETSFREPLSSTMMQSIIEEDGPKLKRQRNLSLRGTRRKAAQKVSALAFTIAERPDSDTENQLPEQTTNVTTAAELGSVGNDNGKKLMARIKGHSQGGLDRSNLSVTDRKLRSKSIAVRRLSPLIETNQSILTVDNSWSLPKNVNFHGDVDNIPETCPTRVLRQRH